MSKAWDILRDYMLSTPICVFVTRVFQCSEGPIQQHIQNSVQQPSFCSASGIISARTDGFDTVIRKRISYIDQ